MFNANSWYSKIPITMSTNFDFTRRDILVYEALIFIASNKSWYGKQEDIIPHYFDRLADKGLNPTISDPGRNTVGRAIEKLRKHGYIETKNLGLKMNNMLKYRIIK